MGNKFKSWLIMLLVFMSVFFVRNLMLPMVSDDIPYAFIWDGEDKGNLHASGLLRLATSSAHSIHTT